MFKIRTILFVLLLVSFDALASKPSGIETVAKDSSASIKFNLRMQTLFTAQRNLSPESNWATNFITRRARLKFQGFAFNPKFQYKMELGLSNRDIGALKEIVEANGAPRFILDAVVKYKINDNLTVWLGQTKLPGNRERVISSQNLQFVDRSLVNSNFNIDRDQGLQLHGKFKVGKAVLKPIISISKGEGRNISVGNINGFNYTGRLEYLPFGNFTKKGDYFGSDLKREEKPKLSIGVSYDYNDGASRDKLQLGNFLTDSNGTYLSNDISTYLVDLMFKYDGFSLMAEYGNRKADMSIIAENGRRYVTGSGYVVQAGYLFKSNFELAGRYTSIESDDLIYSGLRDTKEYTFGISRYIDGHRLKLQSDISIIDVIGSTENDLRFRLQMELGI